MKKELGRQFGTVTQQAPSPTILQKHRQSAALVKFVSAKMRNIASAAAKT